MLKDLMLLSGASKEERRVTCLAEGGRGMGGRGGGGPAPAPPTAPPPSLPGGASLLMGGAGRGPGGPGAGPVRKFSTKR